ncbi:AraC family transcriptional regulator ligand-binding domain-containing protein [Nocardia bhagyanarayanae]|uniref:AraC-like DNA-binding protein n=1 Tax=Nocardia bhagyanarayanae TaxID=1215925 RepID=A0A543FF23_9NOCA|nr:AraC family transcriptional regulator ligand-binding domain-containing protein [Nocardia bhagyanarayanae]TQM32469.1 AraC-like DNA-binding protein [Nocardia bhagyanarayanae]
MKPLARYAALHGYVELGRSLGLDPIALLRTAGLDPAGLSLQDRWVPAAAIADVLERTAAASGCEDFGLRLAERRRFANLGPLSLVIREEPDVRSALRVLSRHENMYNEALRTRLTEHNGIATIRLTLDLGSPGETRQAIELAVGVLHGLLRGFLGTAWQPAEVRFTHPAPRDRRTHHRILGPQLAFEQDFNGIVTYTADLDAPNAMSDPQLRAYAQQLFDSPRNAPAATTLERVRELIELLLPTGRCSVEQIARSLGVDRRTVHRRLAAEGETFTTLVDATRAELARHMVANRRHTLTEIAELLAFSSPGNFSRWFRQRYGCSPSQWRDAAHTSPDAPSSRR